MKDVFESYLHAVLRQLYPEPGQWGTLGFGNLTWCPPGVVFTYGGSVARLSAGIRSGLQLSPELVEAVADLNKTFVAGYFWLVPGQTDHDWQLFWATKMHWDYFQTTDSLLQWIAQVTQAAPAVLQAAGEKFERFGGAPWWNAGADPEPQAILMMANAA
ncbi:hypothetical protein [Kribbella sp. CA-293567]|uniref:hypothetical protein n=1 Tax=Kribbella sp. CA-293567 TaxID=3002436 RepID=UPI0022DE8924|nr:hypothetical protein [Kribbella sp. CA-293567]WBQ08370.1 hypothetical protein OX958_16515 [Kribbella sp. CA-293567]